MKQRYNFGRKGKAMGIGVHAENMDDAEQLAKELNAKPCEPGDNPRTRRNDILIFRDNEPCPEVAKCRICHQAN